MIESSDRESDKDKEDPKAKQKALEEKKASSATMARMTLEEVLADRRFRAEFYDHLEDNSEQQNLEFLEAVEMWKQNCFGAGKKTAKDFDMKTFLAKNIYKSYIDESSEQSLPIPKDIRANLRIRLGIKPKKEKKGEDSTGSPSPIASTPSTATPTPTESKKDDDFEGGLPKSSSSSSSFSTAASSSSSSDFFFLVVVSSSSSASTVC
eukprot:TRINITY_DN24122_c0_g1_i2.p1 TRINITY_DN24122_c0_g1~~TRINITY_DN24122_c0_g1_i2.p1  ORF type:complete len:208 (-),score=43.20 TRINITY_DN24122_c0_g1_i2:146-769(-)